MIDDFLPNGGLASTIDAVRDSLVLPARHGHRHRFAGGLPDAVQNIFMVASLGCAVYQFDAAHCAAVTSARR